MPEPRDLPPLEPPPSKPGPDENLPDSDRRLFDLLDQYVEHLHQEDALSRSMLIERHPELVGLMHCLESLDSLAVVPPADGSDDKTPWDGGADPDKTVIVPRVFEEAPEASGVLPPPDAGSIEGIEFGKYQLLDELGRGGMGVVYRAWQPDLRRHVAIKMILHSRLASPEDVRRFSVEAQSAGGLMHPGIVKIHDVGSIGGQYFYSMEHIDGESLADRLKQGPLDAEAAADLVAQVARAVHYLHQHGVIHRDLKPSNILLDSEGRPHVTDFGLAKIYDGTDSGKTQSGTIVGTPSYMSPEQAAGHASQVSPLCDVYSLGAILYELLCGRPPFQRQTPLDTLVDVIEGEPTLLCKHNPALPRDLELICMRCLEKDPEKRYPSAEALAEDLERFLRGDAIEARPSGLLSKLKRWARREPALVSRLGGVAATALIVQIRYLVADDIEAFYHYRIMGLFGAFAAMSFLFQRMIHNDSLAQPARFGWVASDVLLLTSLLYLADLPIGSILIGYPLLIAAAGLFFLVPLVLFTTVLSLLAFSALLWLRPEIIAAERPHYLVIFAAVLAVQGLIIAHQVHRVRALSRYYEQRRM